MQVEKNRKKTAGVEKTEINQSELKKGSTFYDTIF